MEHEHEQAAESELETKSPELRGSSVEASEFTPCAGDELSLDDLWNAAEWRGKPVVLGEEFAGEAEMAVNMGIRSREELEEILGRLLEPARKKSSPLLIGLGGLKESGKDTVADWLVEHAGFAKVGMSESVHEAALRFDPWIRLTGAPSELLELLSADQDEFLLYSELTGLLTYDVAKRIPKYREALQGIGQDVGRWLAEDIWVRKAEEKISALAEAGWPVVLTGVRQRNELDMVIAAGGASVWVERPGLVVDAHPTENSLTAADFQYQVLNNRSIERLHARTSQLLGQLQHDFPRR